MHDALIEMILKNSAEAHKVVHTPLCVSVQSGHQILHRGVMHSPVIKSDLCNMETIWFKYLSAQNHQQNRIQRPETELF